MKKQVITLEAGKCYRVTHKNEITHLIRVDKVRNPIITNGSISYEISEVWDKYINTNTIIYCDNENIYTEITQREFINALNEQLREISNYIAKIS